MGLLAGCASTPRAAQEPPAAAPVPAVSSESALPRTLNLTELESLEHDLYQSEARLDAELARQGELAARARAPASETPEGASQSDSQRSGDAVGSGASAGPPSGAPRGAPAKRPRAPEPDTRPPPAGPAVETSERGSPCDLGCRALASMQRARTRICEIAGPGPRCQSASERVEAAVERVGRAGCVCLPPEDG